MLCSFFKNLNFFFNRLFDNSNPVEAPIEVVVELKKQLKDKDLALTDVRLDALDKAREVDILRETVNRLKVIKSCI